MRDAAPRMEVPPDVPPGSRLMIHGPAAATLNPSLKGHTQLPGPAPPGSRVVIYRPVAD